MKIRLLVAACAVTTVCSLSSLQHAAAGFTPFVIREASAGGPSPAPAIETTGGVTEIKIAAAGQKAALGSSDLDGQLLGDITQLKIDRLDDVSRFTAGSGPAVGPYLNFWITDGVGNFAVVANEPSNPSFQPLLSDGYDLTFADLSDKTAKVFENSDKSWLPNSGVGLTFGDLAGFKIQAPTAGELTTGWSGLGTGAPRELGTNKAYGVNWVFGDSLANYLSGGGDGYMVSGAAAVGAVPEPSSLAIAIFGIAAAGVGRRRRKSKASQA